MAPGFANDCDNRLGRSVAMKHDSALLIGCYGENSAGSVYFYEKVANEYFFNRIF